jgi:NAD(P)-dependent dehydrogenase (short-subunit alcohol dehydrogenase family)
MKLKDKVAIITGAGSGIGRAIAMRFAKEGALVVIAELDEKSGAETASLIKSSGQQALFIKTDVGLVPSVAELFGSLDERGWQVDVLVNNAGNAGPLASIEDHADELWHSILSVHLNGTFYCMREAVRRMKPRGTGSIINLGSVAGLRGFPGAASYTAAKGAIMALTKGVALEVAPYGIRVNCIAPGWIETPILDNLPQAMRGEMVRMVPLGRIGKPEEIAALALFLASDESSFITGQIISPNGGMYT